MEATTTAPAPAPAATDAPAPETAAPAADPAAQAPVAAQPETTATPAAEPPKTGPMSRRDARKAMHEQRAAERAAAKDAETVVAETGAETGTVTEAAQPKVDDKGRLHDPADGKYLPGSGEPQVDAPAAETRAADEGADPKAESRPTTIRIEIPQGHAIREMGIDALTASTPAEEQAIRALVNGTYTRRQEAETLRAELNELREKLLRKEATESATEKWKGTPEYQDAVERFHALKELESDGTVKEGTASQFWKSVQYDFQQMADREMTEQMSQLEVQEIERAAEAWTSEAWERANAVPEHIRQLPEFGNWFRAAVEAFDHEIQQGHFPNVQDAASMHDEFRRYFGARLISQPKVKAAYEQNRTAQTAAQQQAEQRAAEQARREKEIADAAVEKFRREAAQKRETAPPNPLASLAPAARTDRTSVSTEAEGEDLSKLSPSEMKRRMKMGARADARSHFTT